MFYQLVDLIQFNIQISFPIKKLFDTWKPLELCNISLNIYDKWCVTLTAIDVDERTTKYGGIFMREKKLYAAEEKRIKKSRNREDTW